MTDIAFLRKSRRIIRAQISKLHDKINAEFSSMDAVSRSTNVAKLELLNTDVRKLDSEIALHVWDDGKGEASLEDEINVAEQYSLKIIESISKLRSVDTLPATVVTSGTVVPLAVNKLKLPELPLPIYSHARGESLRHFLVNFENIISKYSLSSYEKFVFLKRQLSGEPLTLVESLSSARQSYENAKDLLIDAFASETVEKFDAIRRLVSLRLPLDGKPYEYASELRVVKDLFTTLKISVDNIMQYFAWSGMNSSLQDQFVHICNTNRPSMTQINDNMFRALERYNEINSRSRIRSVAANLVDSSVDNIDDPVTGFAADVKAISGAVRRPPVQICTLCSDHNGPKERSHSTRDCPVYTSPASKVNKLKSMNACTLCGYYNHSTNMCKFKFNKLCLSCSGPHMTFLCPINSTKTEKNSQTKSKVFSSNSLPVHTNIKTADKVSAGTVNIQNVFQVQVGSDTILPTFTCNIDGCKVRSMKDSGCQPNFIKAALAEKFNMPIIAENVPITINGFNESSKYLTNIVEARVTVGVCTRKINVICVPDIKTKLIIPELGHIVHVMKAKGYKLADEFLSCQSSEISDLEFVLGSSDADLLLEKHIKFGSKFKVPSVYSETSAGILLMGNTKRIINNLSCLPRIGPILDNCVKCPFDSSYNNVSDVQAKSSILPNSYNIIDEVGEINYNELEKAAHEILGCELPSSHLLDSVDEDDTNVNNKLVKYVMNEASRTNDGRLILPLTWRGEVAHLLGDNYVLSQKILHSVRQKLARFPERIKMIDDVFIEQESKGIIERIPNLDIYRKNNPNFCMLPHMPVFKMDRATTKCRVVFLSNLSEKGKLSHNQTMLPGPSLNQKIVSASLHLRFGDKLLCFDLKKAFSQIALPESDCNKLLFLWFEDVQNNNYKVIAYRNLRLSYGLRCSPTLLMLGLYKILIIDSYNDPSELKDLKNLLYSLIYMDNAAYCGSTDQVKYAYEHLHSVFAPYKFDIQQVITNEQSIQSRFDIEANVSTPNEVKLLGSVWRRQEDTLSTKSINLDSKAHSKRSVLSSIASQYDVFGINIPCLNRARMFVHKLQCDPALGWDEKLDDAAQKEWVKIVKQTNSCSPFQINRAFGERTDAYELVVFVDASKHIYAAVAYLRNLHSNKLNFVQAKNRLVNRTLELKSIPSLELQAIVLGVELLNDLRKELAGSKCLFPINISGMKLFTDSSICLHWLNSYSYKLDKMKNKAVFVMNRLDKIVRLCASFPVTFSFIGTEGNPADCATRALSSKQLQRSNYLSGPDVKIFNNNESREFIENDRDLLVKIPNPVAREIRDDKLFVSDMQVTMTDADEHLLPIHKYSCFRRLVRVNMLVVGFINRLKQRVKNRNPDKWSHLMCYNFDNAYVKSCKILLKRDQELHFSEILNFFHSQRRLKDIPLLVSKINLFLDSDGILRVKSKFGKWKENISFSCPILLSKDSELTKLIVRDAHHELAHAGCYHILTHLRKRFYVEHFFSLVKGILKQCVICKRLNSNTVKLNQNSYRDFRCNPPNVPYQYIFMDYIGPYNVRHGNEKVKVYLLIFTCLWSRSINLEVCLDLSVKSFLRAFQKHLYEHGMPSKIFSDLGSQFTAGAGIIADLLKEPSTKDFLQQNGVLNVSFEQYFKGNSSLGSLVEICVKFVKRLIYGAIRNNVLILPDFELLASQVIHLVNKRPIAFKEALREDGAVEVPSPITPELLVKGRDLIAPNVLPIFSDTEDREFGEEFGSVGELKAEFSKINQVRSKLISDYNEQFLNTLIDRATDKHSRYKPVFHHRVEIGDLILLKEEHCKSYHYPMAIVRKIYENEIGEVTNVEAFKGKTRELVKRHISSVIPYMSSNQSDQTNETEHNSVVLQRRPQKRKAALKARLANQAIFKEELR